MAPVDDDSVTSLLQVLLDERQVRLDALDNMDQKAGILLGFSGVVIAFATALNEWYFRLAPMLPSVLAALMAIYALRSFRAPAFTAQALWDRWATKDGPATRRMLVSNLVTDQKKINRRLQLKSQELAAASYLLLAGILLLAVFGLILGGGK
jgi:hypothetical protein